MSPKSTINPITFEKRSCIPKTMLQNVFCKNNFSQSAQALKKKKGVINFCVTMETLSRTKRCLHDNGANFAQARVHSGSLSWLCICLYDTITQVFNQGKPLSGQASHHKMSCRLESHRCEFTPVVAPEREFHSGKKFRKVINM